MTGYTNERGNEGRGGWMEKRGGLREISAAANESRLFLLLAPNERMQKFSSYLAEYQH